MSKVSQLKSSFSKKSPTTPPKKVTFNDEKFEAANKIKPNSELEKKLTPSAKPTEQLYNQSTTTNKNDKKEKSKSVPPSAYEIFCYENSESLAKENPTVPQEDLRELLAKSWKELTKNEKEVFQKRSLNLWKRHDKEVKQLKKKVQNPPYSGYQLYISEHREKFKGLKEQEFRIKCGESWNELSLEEQEAYLKKSLELWKTHDKNIKGCEFEFY